MKRLLLAGLLCLTLAGHSYAQSGDIGDPSPVCGAAVTTGCVPVKLGPFAVTYATVLGLGLIGPYTVSVTGAVVGNIYLVSYTGTAPAGLSPGIAWATAPGVVTWAPVASSLIAGGTANFYLIPMQ